MALLSFYWCCDEVSLHAAWWSGSLLVLIIADYGILVGRSVVMGLLLGLGQQVRLKVPVTLLRLRLGVTLQGWFAGWGPSDGFDEVEAASLMPDHPNVWTDGSLVLDRVTGVSSSGARYFAHVSEDCWSGRRWGHVDRVRPEGEVQSCRCFCSVPGPRQSVQRGEMWGVILALQSSGAVHLGVVRHVGRLLHGHRGSLFSSLSRMLVFSCLLIGCFAQRGLDTVRVTKVKGHADDGMVLEDRVREVDKFGNDAADEAADFGRRSVGAVVIDARRNLSGCVVVAGTQLFLTFIGSSLLFLELWSIIMVGSVLLLILWCGLQVLSPRGVGWFMLCVTLLCCQGHVVSGIRNGLMYLHLLSVMRTLLIGPIPLDSWSNGFPFWSPLACWWFGPLGWWHFFCGIAHSV